MSRSFDGTDDTISILNEANFDFERTDAFSIFGWVKPNVTRSGGEAGYTIVSKLNSSSPFNGWEFMYAWNNAAQGSKTCIRLFLINAFGSNYIDKFSSIDISNDWHHVCATYSGSSTAAGINYYVDGVLGNGTATVDSLSLSILNDITPYIGSRNNAAQWGKGLIADLCIVKKELTINEVRQSMRLPGSLTRNRRGFWPLWGGATEKDYSGLGNTGTLVGTTLSAENPPINGIFTVPKPELIQVF